MPWYTPKIELTTRQQATLSKIAASRTARKDHVIRSKIILLGGKGLSNRKISKEIGLDKNVVGKWRKRWVDNEKVLQEVEQKEQKAIDYRRYIEGLLSDAPRSGAPPKFTEEQLCQLLSVASEKPEDSGLPLSHWSLSSLAEELRKRNIVDSISTSQLSVFLKSGPVKAT